MEKTLVIDGKPVRFKATAATLIRYKSAIGREFLADCARLEQFVTIGEDGQTKIRNVEAMNLDVAYGIAWAMAKTADKEIPDMLTWLDEFDEFDVATVIRELFPMLRGFLKTDVKNA